MATLSETKSAIERSGVGWEAGNTPIGREFAAGSMRRFGFAPKGREPAGGRGSMPSQTFAFNAAPLPSSIDWRSVENKNYVTGIADQGQCGSCVAFATCAVLESRAKIFKQDPFHVIELSEAHLFFCGTTNGCENGWTPASALKHCRDKGVGLEKDFPYDAKQQRCKEISPALHVSRWRRLSNSHERREAIVRRGPVIGGMVVYGDLLWYRSGVYRPVTAEAIGLHAVAIIGFDDELSCWLVKNSWGSGWGEGGYCRIGYGTCGIDAQFPFYDPAVSLPAV